MKPTRLTVRRALSLLVATTVLPMVIGGVVIAALQWRAERTAAHAQLRAMAQTLVMAVDRDMAAAVSRLRTAAASELIGREDWSGFQAYADRVLVDWPGSLLAVTGSDGQLLVNTGVPFGTRLPNLWSLEAEHREVDWEGRPLPVSSQGMTRRVFETGQPQFSNLYYGVSIRRPTLAVAVPVPPLGPRTDALRHVLTLSFPPSSLQQLLERLADRPQLRATLSDRNGLVVATNGRTVSQLGDRVRPFTRLRVDAGDADDASDDIGLYEMTGRDGTHLIGAHAVSMTNGYTVRVSMPSHVAYAAAQSSARIWGGLALAVLLFGALSSAALAARLRRGLDGLAAIARDPVAETAQDAAVPGGSVDEIDAAARALIAARASEARRREAQIAQRLAEEQRTAAAMSEDRLRRVVDTLFAFVGLLDRDGRLVEANRAPLEAAGLGRDDVIGRPFWACYWWTHDDAVSAHVRDTVLQALEGRTARFDVRIRVAGGRLVTIDFQIAPLQEPDGSIRHLVASAVDIDARVRASAELQASEARFRALADNISQLAWIADGAGHIRWFNRRWFEFTGQTEDQALGDGWTAVHDPAHLDRVRTRFLQQLAAGEVWEDTFPLRRHDGQYRWFLSRAVPLHADDPAGVRWFGTNTDVTDQMETETALRHSEERLLAREAALRDADRQKDEFLATLAHELRNPLAPIRTSAELIRLRRSGDPVIARSADIIQRQSGHLARLVDDLLDVSRITLGTVALRMEPLDLRDVVTTAQESLREAVDRAGHVLAVELPPHPVRAVGDPTRLAQVTSNLLHNAVKFTPAGGHLRVTLAVEGDEAVLSVSDDGCGIAPQMIDRVFELFVQERPSGDNGSSGLGIGLALARRLVDMHGGRIEARSGGPGQGSTFVVRLPLRAPVDAAGAPVLPVDAVPPQARATTLVVDDNADAAESLAAVLRLHGHPAEVAYSGAQALAACERSMPDAVVLDIGLPDMSGHEVAARLRRRSAPGGPRPLLIALTGWGQLQDRERAQAAGFDHHLTKPADPSRVLQLLGRTGATTAGDDTATADAAAGGPPR